MRGEETQIAGFLAMEPDFDGTLCLPGTHTKWVRVAQGQIRHFRTAMTGEMFALLSTQSVLRHSVHGEAFSDPAFADALEQALSAPDGLLLDLFSIRPSSLLNDTPAEVARARLSGLLIGSELAATRDYWRSMPVVIIGDAGLSARYGAALTRAGASARVSDHPALALNGLIAAHAHLSEDMT